MDGFRSAELMLVLDLYNIYLFPFVSSIKNHKTAAYKSEQKLKKDGILLWYINIIAMWQKGVSL